MSASGDVELRLIPPPPPPPVDTADGFLGKLSAGDDDPGSQIAPGDMPGDMPPADFGGFDDDDTSWRAAARRTLSAAFQRCTRVCPPTDSGGGGGGGDDGASEPLTGGDNLDVLNSADGADGADGADSSGGGSDEQPIWVAARCCTRVVCCCCLCFCGCSCRLPTQSKAEQRAAARVELRRRREKRISLIRVFRWLVVLALAVGACAAAYVYHHHPAIVRMIMKPCLTDDAVIADVRNEVVATCEMLQSWNLTYWLDYGTALGAWRLGDMIPWDNDADISVLADPLRPDWAEWHHALYVARDQLVRANGFGDSVDLFLWYNETNPAVNQPRIAAGDRPTRTMHRVDESSILGWWNDRYDRFDWPLIAPTADCRFAHGTCRCMNDLKAQARQRYPETWYMSAPYRVRCYFTPTALWTILRTFSFRYLYEGLTSKS